MSDVPATVGAVWRNEAARIVAGLMRIVRDVGLAEELAQDAMVAALEQWPAEGVPANPGAWLMTIAKRRAVDHVRRSERLGRTQQHLARELAQPADIDEPDEPAGDDVLRLMFISCHPVLPTEARVALTLRVIGGLTAAEIARAFLVPEPVITQRIAAAKRTLAEAGVPFDLPAGAELAERLSSVREVVYLIFNEGYAATSGDDLMRPGLCQEALRLGRLLAALAPDEAEAHGLVALMEIQQSRSAARTGPSGEPVQLHEQNRGRWDRLLIRRGFTALLRARELGGPAGPYVLQAAIAVCHAQAPTAEDTDWRQIATLYEALARLMPTPIVQLNRAVAVGMADGPQAGLDLVDTLRADPNLRDYHLLPGVRGDLLLRLGRRDEARREFDRAAAMAGNAAEREFLRRRMAALEAGDDSAPLGAAIQRFLARDGLSAATVRAYRQTLQRLGRAAGPRTPVTAVTADTVAQLFAAAWPDTSPRTWNRHRSAIRSFAAWADLPDLTAGVRRRDEQPAVRPGPIGVHALLGREDLPLRERTLWCLLYESAAAVGAVLALNVEDLDLDDRRAHTARGWVTWRSGTARLLPALIAGRTRGPLFRADRRPGPARAAAGGDLCPDTGRRRLSYERAEYLCKQATGHSLGQLRASGRTTRETPSRTPTSVPAG
jgi:RNA polymerase sigma factor (sigma-70 family)